MSEENCGVVICRKVTEMKRSETYFKLYFKIASNIRQGRRRKGIKVRKKQI